MFRRILACTIAASLLVHVPAHAQGIVYEVFGTYLDSLRDQAHIPALAAAIVDKKGIAWEGAYGRQDIDRAIATRTDTPFNADGLTQLFTAAMVLRCAEERSLSLDDPVGSFRVQTAEPGASIRQLLTHTSGSPGSLSFTHRPERLAPLWPIVRVCAVDSYRETLADLLTRLAMMDSVPGANILTIAPPSEGVPDPDEVERYKAVLERRATPYAVDGRGRAVRSTHPRSAGVLTPSTGLITTVRDLAKFDLALRRGILVSSDTLAEAWKAPSGPDGEALPHGMGWFVQNYRGERIVWQFGLTDDAASSLMITLPSRGLTLILMANSDRLAQSFHLEKGDVSISPFARLFLSLFIR